MDFNGFRLSFCELRRLEVDDLLRCLEAAPYLVRLDASQCGLDMLPDADVFRSQHFLKAKDISSELN